MRRQLHGLRLLMHSLLFAALPSIVQILIPTPNLNLLFVRMSVPTANIIQSFWTIEGVERQIPQIHRYGTGRLKGANFLVSHQHVHFYALVIHYTLPFQMDSTTFGTRHLLRWRVS
jgi:hypothetical protein